MVAAERLRRSSGFGPLKVRDSVHLDHRLRLLDPLTVHASPSLPFAEVDTFSSAIRAINIILWELRTNSAR